VPANLFLSEPLDVDQHNRGAFHLEVLSVESSQQPAWSLSNKVFRRTLRKPLASGILYKKASL
jgi:hypothetical protein